MADEPLLLLRSGYYTRVTFDAACRIAHVQPRISFESNSPQTLIALAETDFGVAVVPATVRLKSQDRLSFRPIMSAGRLLEKRISINWDRCRNQPPYATSFIKTAYQCIHEQFRPVLDTFRRQVDEQVGRLAEVAQGT